MPAEEEELPSTIARSPGKVKRTYKKTLDNAHEQYDSEERAQRTAWASVKNVAEKKGDHWEPKAEHGEATGPSDPQAEQGGDAARARPRRTFGGVNVNKPKKELVEDARRADIPGRSRMTKEELAEALQKHNDRETARARSRS